MILSSLVLVLKFLLLFLGVYQFRRQLKTIDIKDNILRRFTFVSEINIKTFKLVMTDSFKKIPVLKFRSFWE